LSETVLDKIEDLNAKIKDGLAKYDNIYILDLNETEELYNIEEMFDIVKDKEAHMPFTEEYYAAVGTQLARKICAIKGHQHKVIVLDCDNTLWEGICGEQGSTDVKIEGAYKELQEFMLQKYQEGMLLAICSKNNEQDVNRVFDENSGMILRKKHITTWKINWHEKSQNIAEIAKELNLGLDSFIFIDDNPLECLKMAESCPEVLTLQLPFNKEDIPLFLKHVWAFDRGKITHEDIQRSDMYKAENQRKEILEQSISLNEYIKKLELKISMREITENEVTRASQLTQRTNQFNLSTIRRTEEEIRQLIQDRNTKCFVIEAADKFGDYGIVGLVILNKNNNLFIDTFLLSCRILGRKAEDVILSGIKRYAEGQDIQGLEAVLVITEKNKPIQEFFNRTNWKQLHQDGNRIRYAINISDLPADIENIEFYFNKMYKKEEFIIEKVEESFELDHVAIAVKNLKEAEDYYRQLGYKVIDSVFDPLQKSYLSLCISNEYIPIELVAPADEESPSFNKLETQGELPYHLCYRVTSIERFLDKIRNIDYKLVTPPKPAILFHQQRVAFIMIKKVGLIELLETKDQLHRLDIKKNYKSNILKIIINEKNRALEFFKILGYTQGKNIRDTERNILITQVIGQCGEKIELIYPLKNNTTEYKFLTRSGAGIYQILYGISDPDSLGKSIGCKEYIRLCKTEKNKKKAYVDHDLCNIEFLNNIKYKAYLLPILNFTGERLLKLPIFEEVEREIAVCQEPTNEIEEKLVKIWEKALRIQNIGITNDFFELGGDSLSAVNILAWVHKEFSLELTLRKIFELRTISRLAEKISNIQINDVGEESITLISKKSSENLFFVHAGNGEVIPYFALAKVLNNNFSIWGIPFQKLISLMPFNTTIEEIAKIYIKQIKKIQSEGPYYLAGWCFGGAIAFEMARQLEEDGETVKFLGLINSAASIDGQIIKEFNLQNEIQLITGILDNNDPDISEITNFESLWPAFIENYKNQKEIINRIKEEIPEAIRHAIPDYNKTDLRSLVYYLNIMRTLNNARVQYYPKTKVMRACYFSAINDDIMIKDQSANIEEWKKYIKDQIEVYTVKGNHFSIFDEDVNDLAKNLQKALNSAEKLNKLVFGDYNEN
jgi:FkbH-like protein